jgi:chitinase
MLFSPYQDVTVDANWNTGAIQSTVTGTSVPVTQAMPAGDTTLTWAFATGACGSETWAGITPAMIATNVATFVAAGKKYIISTGGQAGSFTCTSDASFDTFISTYYSANMVGVDFDIEDGQSQSDINNLVARVQAAQIKYPNMRFSFTLPTWAPSQSGSTVAVDMGANSPDPFPAGGTGAMTMTAIKAAGLTNYYINPMTMYYGTAASAYCVVSGGTCDMGQSAIQAAMDVRGYYGVPYNQIELTPSYGTNNSAGEDFTVANVDTLALWSKANGIAGLHFWELSYDTGLTYTNEFIKDLGL